MNLDFTFIFCTFAKYYVKIVLKLKPKIFGKLYKYESSLEFIQKIIDIYITLNDNKNKLLQREKEALAYYIMYGYSQETVKDIETSLSKEVDGNYVRVINNALRKKQYLIKDERNKNKNYLSPDMLKIKEYYVENKGNMFMIQFKNK